jgi:hypothetical protein
MAELDLGCCGPEGCEPCGCAPAETTHIGAETSAAMPQFCRSTACPSRSFYREGTLQIAGFSGSRGSLPQSERDCPFK